MHARRPVDQGGVRMITEQQMLAYCELNLLDPEDRLEAVQFYWPAMESVYLEFAEKNKEVGKKDPKKPQHPNNRRLSIASK